MKKFLVAIVALGLLGSAFIHLFWLGLTPWPVWGALVVSVVYLATMLRYG